MLQAQYNSIKKVKQNYMFYFFFAEVGERGEGGKNILMGSEWVQTCKHCFRTIVHETRYD